MAFLRFVFSWVDRLADPCLSVLRRLVNCDGRCVNHGTNHSSNDDRDDGDSLVAHTKRSHARYGPSMGTKAGGANGRPTGTRSRHTAAWCGSFSFGGPASNNYGTSYFAVLARADHYKWAAEIRRNYRGGGRAFCTRRSRIPWLHHRMHQLLHLVAVERIHLAPNVSHVAGLAASWPRHPKNWSSFRSLGCRSFCDNQSIDDDTFFLILFVWRFERKKRKTIKY